MADTYRSEATTPLYLGIRVIWYLVTLVEFLFLFRFFMKLLGANPGAGFTQFIYGLTGPLVSPFISVFGITAVEGSYFEWPTLLAMLFYWFIAWGIARLLLIGRPVSTAQAAHKLNKEDNSL